MLTRAFEKGELRLPRCVGGACELSRVLIHCCSSCFGRNLSTNFPKCLWIGVSYIGPGMYRKSFSFLTTSRHPEAREIYEEPVIRLQPSRPSVPVISFDARLQVLSAPHNYRAMSMAQFLTAQEIPSTLADERRNC